MIDHDNHNHDHSHGDDHAGDNELAEEQTQIAREIGEELTDAFVAFVRGDVAFDDLVFGVFDALSDLNVVASGDYELEEMSDEDGDADEEA